LPKRHASPCSLCKRPENPSRRTCLNPSLKTSGFPDPKRLGKIAGFITA
jgi:hypothetical protein